MLTIALTGAARADQTMIDVAAFGVDAVDCQPAVVVQAVEDRADVLFTLGATSHRSMIRGESVKQEQSGHRDDPGRSRTSCSRAGAETDADAYGDQTDDRDQHSSGELARHRASVLTGTARTHHRVAGTARPRSSPPGSRSAACPSDGSHRTRHAARATGDVSRQTALVGFGRCAHLGRSSLAPPVGWFTGRARPRA
jgi:hypothetical protein